MFSKSFPLFLFLCLVSVGLLLESNANGAQNAPANQPADPNQPVVPNGGVNNDNDAFAARIPWQTFVDPASGQQYGRYVINEPVPILTYSYQNVTESVYVPKTVTESRTTTVTQYIPIQSQQLQLRNVPNWNPFARPQQVWQYVPIVQYVPKNVQVTQPVTFQKFEKEEVTRRVPVLRTETREVPKVVDRPMSNGSNAIANSTNFYQQAAQIAQANRNVPLYPSRPIEFPTNPGFAYPGYPSSSNRSFLAQAPAPYYPIPNYPIQNVNPNQNIASNPIPSNNNPSNQTLVIPAVPLRPNMQPNMQPNSALAGTYGPAANGYYPYPTQPASSLFRLPTFATGTGSLFGSSLFNSNRSANYVASNAPVTQPYFWGNSNQDAIGFRPNTSPYAAPQQGWGISSGNTYRDPMQGGMPATVLR